MQNLTGSLKRPGCALRFADSGPESRSGKVVVFLHGAGMDRRMFLPQHGAVVREGHRAVSLDLRGHGESRPNELPFTADLALEDLFALLAHLKLPRPVLVGHSLGGNLAQAAVRRDPAAFTGLAVLDSTWNTGPLNPVERWLLRIAAPALRIVPWRSLPRIMARASAETPAARAEAERAFRQLGKDEFIEVWDAAVSLVEPEPDYLTPLPLLLVRGAEDHTGNIADAMPEWAAAEGVVEQVVSEAGHIVTLDAPDAVSELLVGFLGGIGRRR